MLMLEMVERVKWEWPEQCGDVGLVERSVKLPVFEVQRI
jgi:hypothetical protein